MINTKQLRDIANVLRRDVAEMTTAAGSGHPSSCFSCAEIVSALFFKVMKYDIHDAENPDNDEFILSKGHAAPILYSTLFHAGCIKNDLMKLRKLESALEGHPTPQLKWVKVATGSLGQGLSVGVGFALAGRLQGRKFRTYVLVGDSEMAEGSNYEAMQIAAHYKLNSLCAIVDVNRLGQRGETMHGWKTSDYKQKFEAFGWEARVVDGHDVGEICSALEASRNSNKPLAIIAMTVKGKGVSFMENKEGWHGRAMNEEELEKALKEIPETRMPKIKIAKPEKIKVRDKTEKAASAVYEIGARVAAREAYGRALARVAASDSRVIAVDAEVSNSTYAKEVKEESPERFVEAFIAEQNLVGMCLGMSKKGMNVFGSTFGAFLSRAHDQIRMSALSSANFTLCGSHAGVSIGEDGASQMALEDIAMFRALPNSIVLYPSDATSTEKLVFLSSKLKGLKYIRTTRGKTPVIYSSKEEFKLGDFKILKQSGKDKVVLAGAGITLHECLKAWKILSEGGIESAVVDLYCVKPFDGKKFASFVEAHGGRVVAVEDHYAEGGIGEMLASELKNSGIKIEHLSVKEIPHSGKPEELLKRYRIDCEAIVKAAEFQKS